MTAVSSLIPGIAVGRSTLMVASVSGGTTPASVTLTASAEAVAGATSVSISASAANTVIRPGSALMFLSGTVRVVVFPTSTSNITLGTTAIAVACQPLLATIAATSTGPWFAGLRPVRGLVTHDFGAEPQEVDLTGTDTPGGMVTGRTRTGITVSGEFFERPGDGGAAAVIAAMNSGNDLGANLWSMFVRDDGDTKHGLVLYSLQSSPVNATGYARHTFTGKYQSNTYTWLPTQTSYT